MDTLRRTYNVIIVDMSPSVGALNRVMTMSCDYILSPSIAGVYNSGSLHSLFTSVFPEWYMWRKAVVDNQSKGVDPASALASWCLHPEPPKLLPLIVTNYQLLDTWGAKGAVDAESSNFVATIKDFVVHLTPDCASHHTLRDGVGMLLDAFTRPKANMVVCLVKNAPTCVAVCEDLGRTVQEITEKLYTEWWDIEITPKKPSKKRQRINWQNPRSTQIKGRSEMDAFMREVRSLKERYASLATWILHADEQRRANK